MPRIHADNVAEHVAQQRAALIGSAVALFGERGYHNVSLAQVASSVGLARNSVYRYVPDKAHLLVEWFREAAPRARDSWSEALAGQEPASERLGRWAETYLDWARTSEHQLVGPLTDELDSLDEQTRAEVADLHRSMFEVVEGAVSDAGIPSGEVSGVVELLSGLVLGAARAESGGARARVLRPRLRAAVAAVLAEPTVG
ncbi:MAG: TetR/AcrR family transcriptional regulator [Microthrixaceae bacterium]|nr:TetR/AcrR family transcriptional regulator [Microthrixaceae bacterium]